MNNRYGGEGNGNPLQYSCLGSPVDRGVWWAAVQGVAQSRTRLKRLSMHACMLWRRKGEGNGNPLQYSCLENPRDRGAWWAAIYGVAQSRTRLTRLSSSSSSNRCGLVVTRLRDGVRLRATTSKTQFTDNQGQVNRLDAQTFSSAKWT